MREKLNGSNERAQAIAHVLNLISGINRDIEISKKMNSNLMVRQYQKLKKEYTQDLLELLSEYKLPLEMSAA